ncbi:MAG: phosphoglycerate kinase [Firmicutes bacterium]|nr:phosphoglycerate kinase [Bacillota bacterium]MCL5039375.1 phosphoglycerate kinase [Bacillota bacterium]
MKKTIRDVDPAGKRVLVRVDFNVPVDKAGAITDDSRIRGALPTIRYLLDKGATVILASHFGRPKGGPEEKYRLTEVGRRLQELLGLPVRKLADCVGPAVKEAVDRAGQGEVILLENVRFHPEEEKNDPGFARQLAELADLYVNDAFGAAHRAHASTTGVAQYLPAVAGLLMEREIRALGEILEDPRRPFLAIIGGAKVSDKIGVLESLVEKVDTLVIGGGMANTFFLARGWSVGKSLSEADEVPVAQRIMERARSKGVEALLPVDVVVASSFSAEAERRVVAPDQIPGDWTALDIGPTSAERFGQAISQAATVFWNGPMGVFELEPFAAGTLAIARAVAAANARTVIGGGDSVAAVEKAGVADQITHISTGGGASLEFIEGKALPGVAALQEK